MINKQYKYSEITENIIGCAMRVHQKMQNGYPEKIYNNCLIIEFKKESISFQNELELPIYYEMTEVGKRRVDFLVDGKVLLEIKAISELTDTHLAQALNYLDVLNLEVGFLLNFGAKSLEIKRIINNKVKESL
jgi:GxxExxY protein